MTTTDDPAGLYQSVRGPDAVPEGYVARGWLGQARLRVVMATVLAGATVIADVGGGDGDQAAWLAARGHCVHLSDPASQAVARYEKRLAAGQPKPLVADGRHLPYPDEMMDACLALGPFYHLSDSSERQTALLELRRITKPGGAVLLEFMPPEGVLLLLAHRHADDPSMRSAVRQILTDGRAPGAPTRFLRSLTFLTAHQMRTEARRAGFEVVRVAALEGPFWTAGEGALSPAAARGLLRTATERAESPSVVSLSPHAVCVARVPATGGLA